MSNGVNSHSSKIAKSALIVPLVQPGVEQMLSAMHQAAQMGADMVECRLDYLTDPPTHQELENLMKNRPEGIGIIATCRPTRQGGKFTGNENDRINILSSAAQAGADYIDIEMDVPESNWPDGKIILSHHDFTSKPANLQEIFNKLDASRASVNKIVFKATCPEDAIEALNLIGKSAKPTIALAMGEPGLMSRILAAKFNAFGTFAAMEKGLESAPGQPTVDEMKTLYRWDAINSETLVYGVIGCPIAHSMSPAVHNAAFADKGINAVYLPLRIEAGGENFNRFMDAAIAADWLSLRGLSVTIPHKENAIAYLGEENCDELSRQIGAINTIAIAPDGSLRGINTDYAAAIDALCSAMRIKPAELASREVAVIGAGGVARAIVAALAHYKAKITIYNRTFQRAEKLAKEFGCLALPLEKVEQISHEIVINCTSIGMFPNIDESVLTEQVLSRVRVVFDTVYNPPRTRLLELAEQVGCLTVSGVEMFVNQAAGQFEFWLGVPAPRQLIKKTILDRLNIAS